MSTQFRDVNRTVNPGDVVITLADVFDRLQSRVDPNTLDQLLRDIISGRRNQVRPGELITAELMNQILAQLESLETRVSRLEAGSGTTPNRPVEIIDITPHGTRTINDEITVIGKNFLTSAERNQVRVGSKDILLFKAGSDSEHLIFDIPDLSALNLDPNGSPVTVSVQNTNGTASRSLQIKPLPTFPKGTLQVQYTNAPIVPLVGTETFPTIKAGESYIFIFTATTNVDRNANYNLVPTMSDGAWRVQVLNESDQPITQIPIQSGPRQTVLRVRVTTPAAGAGASSSVLTLQVIEASEAGGVPPGSDQFTIAIGQRVPVPNTAVGVGIRPLPSDVTVDGGRLVFPIKESAVSFNVNVTVGGIFRVTASFRDPTGWSTREPFITGQTLDAGTSGASRDFSIHVIATAASRPTDLMIQLQRTSGEPLSVTHAQAIRAASA